MDVNQLIDTKTEAFLKASEVCLKMLKKGKQPLLITEQTQFAIVDLSEYWDDGNQREIDYCSVSSLINNRKSNTQFFVFRKEDV